MTQLDGERSPDADLVELARQGDEFAWEDLVRKHQEAVFRLAYLLIGDPDDAADISQETFIRASRALRNFDLQRPLRPWLMRIATNLTRNRWRFLSRYRGALQRLGLSSKPAQSTLSRLDDRFGEYESLWKAVDKLSPKDREVIYLRFFLDMSIGESAEALNLAEGTIKSRTHRALRRLREAIDD